MKDFAYKRQVKRTSCIMEPSNQFHTLVKLVDAGDNMIGKIPTLDLLLEINDVMSKLETQNLPSET